MRRLLWLGAVFGVFLLPSCGSSVKKTSPQDVIGDEEYRVMSAVLKAEKMRRNAGHRETYLGPDESGDSTKIDEGYAQWLARFDSTMRSYPLEPWCAGNDPAPSRRYYDSLVQKYGADAYYIVRNGGRCGPLYDSLLRRHGDLSYYVTVYQNTLKATRGDSPEFKDTKAASRLSADLVRSFDSANLVSYGLNRERFTDSLVVDLISSRDVDSTLSPIDWWPALYERYPLSDGTIRISRVGFNSDTTVAVVRVKAMSGSLSGAEWFSLLEKKVDRWILVAEQVYLVN